MLPAAEYERCYGRIVDAYSDLAEAVACLNRAMIVDQTTKDRALAKSLATEKIECLRAHFSDALDAVPDNTQ